MLTDGWWGWEQLMTALRAYERLFRDEPGRGVSQQLAMMGEKKDVRVRSACGLV